MSEWIKRSDRWLNSSISLWKNDQVDDICMWSWFHSSSSTQSNLTDWRSRGSIYFQIQRLNVSLCGIQLVRSDFNGLFQCWWLKLRQKLETFQAIDDLKSLRNEKWLMMPTTCLLETYFCVNQIQAEFDSTDRRIWGQRFICLYVLLPFAHDRNHYLLEKVIRFKKLI